MRGAGDSLRKKNVQSGMNKSHSEEGHEHTEMVSEIDDIDDR